MKKLFTLMILLCIAVSYSQSEEPIEYTRDMYVDEINRLDNIIEQQEEQILVLQNVVNKGTAFCEGFEDGYKAGYCYKVYGCIEPIPPICPIPDIGESFYKDGYNKGFSKGRGDQ